MKYFDHYPALPAKKLPYKLSEEPYIHESCSLRKVYLGAYTALGAHTRMNEVRFGDYSYTAGNVSIAYSEVGKFASIANSVRINPGNHPQWRVTQHHCTYRRIQYGFDTVEDEAFFQWRRDHACAIGHDVWIGHGALIMPGIRVGSGAIVGAGAVVTKDVAPYTIVVGVPAVRIKARFPAAIAQALQEIAWWNWDRETLEARFDELMDVEKFVATYSA